MTLLSVVASHQLDYRASKKGNDLEVPAGSTEARVRGRVVDFECVHLSSFYLPRVLSVLLSLRRGVDVQPRVHFPPCLAWRSVVSVGVYFTA